MARYIALLRGVNIGGNVLKMDRLRELCRGLGFEHVQTYLQSGNVLFETSRTAAACVAELQKSLIGQCRLPVCVIIRTPKELQSAIERNPFPVDVAAGNGISFARLYVTFLASRPHKSAVLKLSGLDFGSQQFHYAGKEIYMHLPDGAARSKLSNNLFEKLLGVRATTRNWNTITTLHSLADY